MVGGSLFLWFFDTADNMTIEDESTKFKKKYTKLENSFICVDMVTKHYIVQLLTQC